MGIKDIPDIARQVELKKEFNKPGGISKKKEGALKKEEVSEQAQDTLDISDAKVAVEKENILASKTSIADFEHANALLESILADLNEKNLLEIHGNANRIKTFLIM